ncbi:SapC family protein [Methylobacterium nigriterrae]|uniref:SapC family protein n=1 Tax=Methylobacterium nigriterrae TaxID=3127512 RepID=UPI0030138469
MSHPRVPLRPDRLQNLRWSFPTAFSFARQRLTVPLIHTEILRAAREYPVAFESDTGAWRPVAYLGDVTGQANRFIDEQGRWIGSYVPFWLRVRPFLPEADAISVLLDPDFVGVSGTYAFTQDGQTLTPEAQDVERQLQRVEAGRAELEAAASALVEGGVGQMRPAPQGSTGPELAFIAAHRAAEIMGAKTAEWYARSPRAVELAIAAAFSSAFLPRVAPAQVTLPASRPKPETRPAVTAPLYVPPAAPAELDWLDMNEKVMF